MTRYNALMDQVLNAGLHEAIKASGFRRKRPRFYVRETTTGYDFVYFHRAGKFGEWFCDALGTFYQPMADLYDEVFPDGSGDINFPSTFWPLPVHILSTMMINLMTTVESTPGGDQAFRVEDNEHFFRSGTGKSMLLSKNAADNGSWITPFDRLDDLTEELIGHLNTNARTWFDHAKDPAFIASWLVFRGRVIHYNHCHAAAFYFLAGDDRRARKLLLDCIEQAKTPFEALDKHYREDRFLGLIAGRSSEESRRRATSTLDFYSELAAVARTLADHCGYDNLDG